MRAYRSIMMTDELPKESPETMCINDRTAIESIASILRHLVANGAIGAELATNMLAGSGASLADPRARLLWADAAMRVKMPAAL